MKLLAIDPATNCGWAHSAGPYGTWDLSVRRDESGGMRLVRLQGKLNEMCDTMGVEIVVFEAARNCAPRMQGALVVQAELQATIKLWCETHSVQYRGYSPTEIKKHATGKGNANKAAMLKAAREQWPDFKGDDNAADARWLLQMAQLNLNVPLTV